MKESVILDCDPGHDDAIALIMAVAAPNINLLGVTTSAGNQMPAKTLNNAMRILTLLEKSIPVASGSQKPLLRKLKTNVAMHGITGLDGADLPEPNFHAYGGSVVEFLANKLKESLNPVTIVVTGPCTNIALFLSLHAELKSDIKQIVILGGGMGVGNKMPTTEFNMLNDPEAAKIVFESGVKIVLFPLNVAFKAQLMDKDMNKISKIKNKVSRVVLDLLNNYGIQFNQGTRQFEGIPLYDPCCISWLINPNVFSGKDCHVDIETKGEFTTGETVIDYYDLTSQSYNAFVLFNIKRELFVQQILDSLDFFSSK